VGSGATCRSTDSGQDFGLVLFTGVSTYTSAVAALDEFETKILKKLAS
jgi:hypothetical protein